MTKKAKRVITDFNFEEEGASVHLVSKKQGGAANGFTTLIKKSNATVQLPEVESLDIQKKLEQIKVTLSMEEFLRKFFNLWSDDAELLTAMLGYETEHEAYLNSLEEHSEPMTHADYIASKLSSFEIMKSMHEGERPQVSALEYVTILELQENLEKHEEMMDKVSIEKSRFAELEANETKLTTEVELRKSLEAQVQELTGELDTLKKAQADAEAQAMKARIEGLVAEDKIEAMTKSLLAMDQESADLMVQTLKDSAKKVEESDLFVEKSAEGEPEVKDEKQTRTDSIQKAYNEALGIKE